MPYGRRGGEFVVNANLVGSQLTPSIAGFAGGGFIVVWSTTDTTQDGAGRAIKAQRFDSFGMPVGPEFLVNSSAAGDQRAPSVTTLSSGGYVITWETGDTTQDGSGTAIKGQVYDSAGAAVGAEFRVNSQLVADQTRTCVTGLEGGGFVVTWQSADPAQDGHSSAIKGQIYSAAGVAVGGEFLVNSGAVGGESAPSVTSLAGGGFVAAWTLGSGQFADVYAQVFDSSGAKVGGQFIVSSTTALNQDSVSVAELSDGRFVVTWQSASSLTTSDNEIRARSFSASGTPLGNDFVVSTTKTNASGTLLGSSNPQVLELPDGGFLITWSLGSTDYMKSSIRGQYFDASGARVGTEFLVSTVTDRTESNPDIAIDGNGNIFAVWSSANTTFTDYDIRGQVYTPSGAPEIVSNGGGGTAALSVAENQIAVTTVAATDPEGSALTYSIVGGLDASRFAINASTGALTFVQARNFEQRQDSDNNNVYEVVVSVSDGVNSDIQALAVTITNVNEAPTINGSQTSWTMPENNPAVATFTATDPDGDAVTWSIAGGADAARFTIDAATGALRFVAAPNYEAPADAGANNFYDVVISAGDGTLSSTRTLSIEILNWNEGPVITSGGGGSSFALTHGENVSVVMNVTAVDPDQYPSPFTYSIVGGADASKFTIQAQTGQLLFKVAPNFEAPTDVGGDNVYDVIVAASDGWEPADTQAIAITVVNANESPTITSNGGGTAANISIAENGVAVTTVTSTDIDGPATTYSIVAGSDAALFTIDATTGVLRFIAAPDFEAPTDSGGNNVYNLVVRASDGSLSDTQSIAVTVTGVNEDIVLAAAGAFSAGENESAVGTIAASDPEGAPISYAIAGGADASLFAIDAATGALSFVAAPDFEAPGDAGGDNVYDVVVSASDGVFARTQAVTVTVGDANEAVTIHSDGGGATAALAATENGLAVTTVAATDADGTSPSYAIVGGADAGLFTINAVTGALSFLSAPDFEAPGDADGDNVYDVVVAATDGSLSDTQALAVTVGNANEGVTITSDGGGASAALSVAENGLAVTTVAAADADGTSPSYAIVGGADAGRFTIDAVTGALAFVSAPDFEAPADADADNVYDVIVAASDGSFTDTQAIAVTVGNANEGVVITSGGGGASASVSVAENGQAVATVAATDADGTGPSYAIVGGADAGRFTIDAATGALAFVSAPDFEAPADADGDNVYDVVVAASDGSFTDAQAIAVTVGNTNEGVAITSNGGGASAALSLAENVHAVTIVAASDLDGTSPSYAIVGGADAARFAIDAATGALAFVSAPDFEAPADSDGDNVYDVVVAASDGSFSDTQALAVTVGNVNDLAPVIGYWTDDAIALSSLEGQTVLLDVDAVDGDGDSIGYSLAGADAALFAIDPETGAVRFLDAPDYEAPGSTSGSNIYHLTVIASDGLLTDTLGITVTVTNVNEAIAITSGGAYAIAENGTAVGQVIAADQDGTAPIYSIAGGADAALFAIDAATGSLTFLSAPDFESPGDAGGDNVYDLIVSASDGSLADSRAISVTVTNADEPILFTSSASVVRPENAEATFQVTAADPDGPGAPIVYSIAGGADAARFWIDASTGLLSYIGIPDHEAPGDADGDNLYHVVVAASDGPSSATQAIAFAISDVNEAPRILSGGGGSSASYGVDEGGTAVATIAAVDGEGSQVTYSITGGSDAALFAIDALTGALSLIQAPDYEAPADSGEDNFLTVIVTASDGTLSSSQLVQVLVANVNEGLSITSGSAFSIAENGTSVATITAVDIDGTAPVYSIAGGADAALFAIDAATGALRFLTAPNFEAPGDAGGDNVYDLIVLASDGELTDTRALTVTVTDTNESVAITSGGGESSAAVSVEENGLAVTDVAAVDPDGAPVTYAIAGGADASRFTIDALTGALSFVAAPDFEEPGDAGGDNVYDVVVSASDGVFTDTQALAVTVGNANEGVTIVSNGGGATASVSVAENGTAVAAVAAVDADGMPVTYAIAGGADAARFTIDALTGALSFIAAPDFEAPGDAGGDNVYDVIVSASDGSLGDSQALQVVVGNVDEGVTINSDGGGSTASVSVAENGLAVTAVAATDADGGAVTYSIAGGADAARFTIDAATGALRFVAAPNFESPADAGANNVYDVIVRASDGVFADTQAIAVTVTNVREGNIITGTSANNTISTSTSVSGQPRATELEDTIYGMGGADTISGAGGDDIIDGGSGNDVITGGLGADVLTGGTGADRFTYNLVTESPAGGRDLIMDFSRADGDKISLSGIDANVNAGGNQAFAFIGTGAFSGVAGQLRYETIDGRTYVSGDVNGDRAADFTIELNGPVALIASDFLL